MLRMSGIALSCFPWPKVAQNDLAAVNRGQCLAVGENAKGRRMIVALGSPVKLQAGSSAQSSQTRTMPTIPFPYVLAAM